MAEMRGLSCIRCGTPQPAVACPGGCPVCAGAAPSALTVEYAPGWQDGLDPARLREGPESLWRYDHSLPVDRSRAVSMGEGRTPLVDMPALAQSLGLGGLWGKCEFANPTGSFKDRLASVAVSTARARFGARVIASSSSGNAGAAAAAYAARAGLPCVVFTFTGTAGPMVTQMRAHGAVVLAVEDKADRWRMVAAGVARHGWFPTSPYFAPPVGSTPYGVEGYKSIAYEVVEALEGAVPNWLVLPVCYGDAMLGIWRGFAELIALGWIDRAPRMVAAEIHGSAAAALASGEDALPSMPVGNGTIAVSIAAAQGCFQTVQIARQSGGTAVAVEDSALLDWQGKLARREGLFVEPSAAATLAALERLRAQGIVAQGDTALCLLTAGGLKDPAPAERQLGPIPVVPPDLDRILERVARTHGIDLTG